MITFEYFLEQSQKKRSQIESALHERKTSDEQLLFNSELINKIYTLNLFESNQHFNLWKYHADNFAGLCITLNLDSIKNGTYNKKKQLRKVQAINYTQDKEIENTKDNPLPGIFDMPVELVNEKGWRLAIAKQQCHYNKEKQYILNLKKTDIDSITFGINIDKELKESTMRYFKTDLNLKHITFQQLYTSNRHFEFSVRPLK